MVTLRPKPGDAIQGTCGRQRQNASRTKPLAIPIPAAEAKPFAADYADECRWEKPNMETETREKQNPHHCTDNNG